MDNTLHHFVPQFYLNRFVDPYGLLWVYDKDTDRIFSANPRNLAAERGFYALPEDFPDPTLMEQQFSALEQEAALISEDWVARMALGASIEIPDVNRETMSLFISTQLLRTSEARTMLVQGLMDPEADPVEQRNLHTALLWNDDVVSEISEWVHGTAPGHSESMRRPTPFTRQTIPSRLGQGRNISIGVRSREWGHTS